MAIKTVLLSDNFTQFVSKANEVIEYAGDSAFLTTTADTLSTAIVELDSDLFGSGGGSAASLLNTTSKNIAAAINEIEAVFNADNSSIDATTNFGINVIGNLTSTASGNMLFNTVGFNIDASGDIGFDAGGNNINLLENGTNRFVYTLGAANTLDVTGSLVQNISSTLGISTGGEITLTANSGASNIVLNSPLVVNSNLTANGNTTLGNATTDLVTFTARVNSNVLPSTDNTYDLGSATFAWNDLWVDGTATIATADINGGAIDGVTLGTTSAVTSAVINSLTVNTSATIASADINGGTIDGVSIGQSSAVTALTVDNITIDGATVSSTAAVTIDAATDIVLDAAGLDVFLRSSGTNFGALTNSAGQLVIKSGTVPTTAMTFSNANITFAGTLTVTGLTTTASTLQGAINEHDTEIGNVALINDATGYSATTVVGGITELQGKVGNFPAALDPSITATTNIVTVLNEFATEISALDSAALTLGGLQNLTTTDKSSYTAAINELHAEHGTLTSLTTAAKTNFVAAINELQSELGAITSLTTTTTTNAVAAINELHAEHGTLSSLTTTAKTNFVAAINEVDARIIEVYNSAGTLLNP